MPVHHVINGCPELSNPPLNWIVDDINAFGGASIVAMSGIRKRIGGVCMGAKSKLFRGETDVLQRVCIILICIFGVIFFGGIFYPTLVVVSWAGTAISMGVLIASLTRCPSCKKWWARKLKIKEEISRKNDFVTFRKSYECKNCWHKWTVTAEEEPSWYPPKGG
jgi:hypothetical protein